MRVYYIFNCNANCLLFCLYSNMLFLWVGRSKVLLILQFLILLGQVQVYDLSMGFILV
ncbi:hypothetical protein RchiOBHm_Chr6g0268591 [Rosa chinensis]|uniref:Uncharacterized protein n=1 Tax=Rosa chinensis TaxID=74649 RepID=A0A2P6PQ84_ROSCH|nr:hypothetical protein RchiOBHm_Chr6g0268591 [Rosa chinensis]